MKLRHVISVAGCVLLASSVQLFAQADSFHKYLFDMSQHRQSPELLAFAKGCGITPPSEQRFAFGQDGWRPAKDLVKQVAKTDSEFLATAEIWLVDAKPRLVITWSTTSVGAQEQLSCIDSAEKVTQQQIKSWSTVGSNDYDEIIINKATNKAGDLVQTSAELIPNNGERKPMGPTQMKNELYQWGTKYPNNRTLNDFQFPAILFKQGKR